MKSFLVLMSTYNGEKFISEQLESIKEQKNVIVDLIIRDDGSSDNTVYLINKFIYDNNYPKITLVSSVNCGLVKSFFELVNIAYVSEKKYDYYAFSDQDDYWLDNKLDAASSLLELLGQNKPVLYFSQTQRVDEKLNYLPTKKISIYKIFAESLMYHCATGCTEVFNFKLLEIVSESLTKIPSMHDSYFYQVCLAVGGDIVFDERSYILYRQHSNNVIGGKEKFLKRWKRRLNQLFINHTNERLKNAEAILFNLGDKVTAQNKLIIEQVIVYRTSFIKAYKLLNNKEFRSKSFVHNLNFIISVLIKMY